jgi:hypothetical protein
MAKKKTKRTWRNPTIEAQLFDINLGQLHEVAGHID